MIAAGDIADCRASWTLDDATARIVDGEPNALVQTLGDNAYPSGTSAEFANCYHPTWGRFKSRTRPALGNHEYRTPGASGYFGYFGVQAGDPAKGYYSYDYGKWHVVVLNTNWRDGGPSVAAGSDQLAWLFADLASSNRQCTIAVMHHPRFSSGERGNDTSMAAIWNVLYRAGVDVVINGHDHLYERLAPANPGGVADPAFGIRQFTVGTGGTSPAEATPFKNTPLAISERRQNSVAGVLRLELDSTFYRWRFMAVEGLSYEDEGTDVCHGPPPSGSASALTVSSPLSLLAPGVYPGRRRSMVPLLENRWKRQPPTTHVTYLARN